MYEDRRIINQPVKDAHRLWEALSREVEVPGRYLDAPMVPPAVVKAIGDLRTLEEGIQSLPSGQEKDEAERVRDELAGLIRTYVRIVKIIERAASYGYSDSLHYREPLFKFLHSENKLEAFVALYAALGERSRPLIISNGLFADFAQQMFREAVRSIGLEKPSPHIGLLATVARLHISSMSPETLTEALRFSAEAYAAGQLGDLALFKALSCSPRVQLSELREVAGILHGCSPVSHDDASIMLAVGKKLMEGQRRSSGSSHDFWRPQSGGGRGGSYLAFGFYSALVNALTLQEPSDRVLSTITESLGQIRLLWDQVDPSVVEEEVHSMQYVIADSIAKTPWYLAEEYACEARDLLRRPWGSHVVRLWEVCSLGHGTDMKRAGILAAVCLESQAVTKELGSFRDRLKGSTQHDCKGFCNTLASVLEDLRTRRVNSPALDNTLELLKGFEQLTPRAIKEVLLILGVPSLLLPGSTLVTLPWVAPRHPRRRIIGVAHDILDNVKKSLGPWVRWRVGMD